MFYIDGVIYLRQPANLDDECLCIWLQRFCTTYFGAVSIERWIAGDCVLSFILRAADHARLATRALEAIAEDICVPMKGYLSTQCTTNDFLIDHLAVTYRYLEDQHGEELYPHIS
jgi:hypothetical protein